MEIDPLVFKWSLSRKSRHQTAPAQATVFPTAEKPMKQNFPEFILQFFKRPQYALVNQPFGSPRIPASGGLRSLTQTLRRWHGTIDPSGIKLPEGSIWRKKW